ncbi:MAG: tRNA (adenosine(37)-N6)-threonylcarbamoyltransferase complex dimerization subunit type 1 TsaB [Phycisphaeraceae bacterium]
MTATDRPYNLAIETSGRSGSITLGQHDSVIATADLPHKRRHNVELIPMIDQLCKGHGITPALIGQVYVSLGPGSFTGLRVGIATVKMLALAHPIQVFGIPTLDVLAENAPKEAEHVAVCLNLKRDTVHCAVYQRTADNWQPTVEPALRTLIELLELAPRPLHLIGDPLPPLPDSTQDVTVLPPTYATAQSEAVYKLGRLAAATRPADDPMKLAPLYIREPEAVTLWNEKHGPPPGKET